MPLLESAVPRAKVVRRVLDINDILREQAEFKAAQELARAQARARRQAAVRSSRLSWFNQPTPPAAVTRAGDGPPRAVLTGAEDEAETPTPSLCAAGHEDSTSAVNANTAPRRRKRTRPADPSPEVLAKTRYLSVRQTAIRFPAFTEASLRHLIFKCEPERLKPLNGVEPQGFARCIKRDGGARKIQIDCEELEALLRSGARMIIGR